MQLKLSLQYRTSKFSH